MPKTNPFNSPLPPALSHPYHPTCLKLRKYMIVYFNDKVLFLKSIKYIFDMIINEKIHFFFPCSVQNLQIKSVQCFSSPRSGSASQKTEIVKFFVCVYTISYDPYHMAIGVFPSKNIVEVSTCGEGGEGAYTRVYGDGVAWVWVL